MYFGRAEKDTMREDMQRQKFVHSLVSHLSNTPATSTATNADKHDFLKTNIVEPLPGPRNRTSRMDVLKEKIKQVERKLNLTEEKRKESAKSKKELTAKLKILEQKITPGNILAKDFPSERDVAEWTRLTQAMKEAGEKARKIKELEVKERTIREGFSKVEKLLAKSLSFDSVSH